MNKNQVFKLILLRYAVGFLGEKAQYNWWGSSFLTSSTKKMLAFTFPRTAYVAQYEALNSAAARKHDDSIGLGKSYHLFRLPEYIEKNLVTELKSTEDSNYFESKIPNKEAALDTLVDLAVTASVSGEGAVYVGSMTDDDMDSLLAKVSSAYLQAFNEGKKAFPYFQRGG